MLLLLSSANINAVPRLLTFTVLLAVSVSGVSLRCVKPSPVSSADTSISRAFSLPTVMTPPPVAGMSCSVAVELVETVPNPTFPF